MEDSVEVEIFGSTYQLKSGDDAEYAKKLAAYVDKKMNEINKASKVVSTNKVAVLASLNIADEMFEKEKEIRQKIEKEIGKKSEHLINLIDKAEAS